MNLWKDTTEETGWPMRPPDNISGARLVQGDGCGLYENGIEIKLNRNNKMFIGTYQLVV